MPIYIESQSWPKNMTILIFFLIIRHPFTQLIVGPTSCGKTHYVQRFLQNLQYMVDPIPTKIIVIFKHWQPAYESMGKEIDFRKEIQLEDLTKDALDHQKTILILDDVFADLSDHFLYEVYTNISHHNSVSVICLLNFLFMKTKVMRLLATNSHVTTLFKSPRDMLSISLLNTHMFPQKPGFLTYAISDATKNEKYSSLTIDCSPHAEDITRVRKTAFPGDEKVIIYLPEKR